MEEFNVSFIPELKPNVEKMLLVFLSKEVTAYTKVVQGERCILCPFRKFTELRYLKAHLRYHCAKNMYMASSHSPQRAVVRAYFNYCQSVVPVTNNNPEYLNLIQYSATLIRDWNVKCSKETLLILHKLNRPVLFRVLTHLGPQYLAKELTRGCIRHSAKIYYTPMFCDLFLSMLLTNHGRILTSVDALYLYLGSISDTPNLLPNTSVFWNDLTEYITSHTVFKTKITQLKYKAALAGELEVISHDETFKTLFSLIGQDKMSQKIGELHAVHTFRGYTGCTFGISSQRSTSNLCFEKAVKAIFDDCLASKVKFIFSDSPLRIAKTAKKLFKSLYAVGEDPIHLPIRLECCFGEKKTEFSSRVRQLHGKFRVPTSSVERFWQYNDVINMPSVWLEQTTGDTRTSSEWQQYCKCSFNGEPGFTEYVKELRKISITFSGCMQRTNSKNVTVLQILKNGASRIHYEGLQNSSRLFARLGIKGVRLGLGTTRNEQLHKELKCWMRNIFQIHRDRLQRGFRIFELSKLLTHSSAAYSPTITQLSQQRLLFTIASKFRRDGIFSTYYTRFGESNLSRPLEQKESLDFAYYKQTNSSLILTKKANQRLNKQNRNNRRKRGIKRSPTSTNIFKRPRIKIKHG